MRTAILVDGAFYLKRANRIFGKKSAEDRASELYEYCLRHLKDGNELYRIFFYNCTPSSKTIYNPLTKRSVCLKHTDQYTWTNDFHSNIIMKRKVAMRRGELLESSAGYVLTPTATKQLLSGEITVADLTEKDLKLDIQQKGVDTRICLDIASLAHKKLVDRIVLIAGDSDFVPAAKHARREGIDFVLDPMWQPIKPSLNEHIDGLQSCTQKPPKNLSDPLCVITEEENQELLMPV